MFHHDKGAELDSSPTDPEIKPARPLRLPPAPPSRTGARLAVLELDIEREAIREDGPAGPVRPANDTARPSVPGGPKRGRPAGELAPDARPVIRIGPGLHEIAEQAIRALCLDPALYQRDGALVHVVYAAEADADPETRAPVAAGTPQIRTLAPATLRLRLCRAARWKRSGKGVEAVPPDTIVQGVHAAGEWPGIRQLAGILEAPALRPDGTVICTPGYDKATGFLYAPTIEFPPVPEAPTQDDARAALAELVEVFADFPYKAPEHLSVAIAAILSLIARPAIRGAVPGFIFDANTRGSGKTLQADGVSLIGTGRTTAKRGFPPDDTELEKVLGAYAIRGAVIVSFDNVARPFGGAALDLCLTAGEFVELRVLGRSEIASLRWYAVILASGNNVILFGDTPRRVLFSRLESQLENPEERTGFKHPDLLAWIRAERPRLVRAALTVLRAFVVAERPRGACKTWGSFEAWSALIPPAIVFAGGADPMLTRPAVTGEEEPEKAALTVLLRDWPRLDSAGTGLSVKQAIGLLYTPDRLRGCKPDRSPVEPDGFDDLREAIETLAPVKPGYSPSPVTLGNKLASMKGRLVAGRKLVAGKHRTGIKLWQSIAAGGAES